MPLKALQVRNLLNCFQIHFNKKLRAFTQLALNIDISTHLLN